MGPRLRRCFGHDSAAGVPAGPRGLEDDGGPTSESGYGWDPIWSTTRRRGRCSARRRRGHVADPHRTATPGLSGLRPRDGAPRHPGGGTIPHACTSCGVRIGNAHDASTRRQLGGGLHYGSHGDLLIHRALTRHQLGPAANHCDTCGDVAAVLFPGPSRWRLPPCRSRRTHGQYVRNPAAAPDRTPLAASARHHHRLKTSTVEPEGVLQQCAR